MMMRSLLPVVFTIFSQFGATIAVAQLRADLDGHVWFGSTPLCALVLVNGQSIFSCNPSGPFELLDVPLDANGQLEAQIFAAGFAPFKQKVTPTGPNLMASFSQVNMTRVKDGRVLRVNETYAPTVTEGFVTVQGTVNSDGAPVCALVLANGKKMFTCNASLGTFSLDVPVDQQGNVTLMAFASGFQPYKTVTSVVDIDTPTNRPNCVNLAGSWQVTDTVSLTCRLGGESESLEESGSGRAVIEQNGCEIRIESPIADLPRIGSIDGNRVKLSGQFIVPTPQARVTENTLSFDQTIIDRNDFTLIGVGSVKGSLGGSSFTCEGDTTSRFTR